MTLTSVVLPAPLGPINPWIDPCSTSSDTPSTACTPPKCRWTLSRRRSTDSSPARPPCGSDDGQPAASDDALRPEDDHGDQEDAGDDVDVVVGLAEDPGQGGHHQRTDHRSQKMAAAAEHCESQDLNSARDPVLLITWVDEEVEVRFESSGDPGEDRAEDERDHLVASHVDALAQGGELVLANRRPCGSKPAFGEAPHDEEDNRQ